MLCVTLTSRFGVFILVTVGVDCIICYICSPLCPYSVLYNMEPSTVRLQGTVDLIKLSNSMAIRVSKVASREARVATPVTVLHRSSD